MKIYLLENLWPGASDQWSECYDAMVLYAETPEMAMEFSINKFGNDSSWPTDTTKISLKEIGASSLLFDLEYPGSVGIILTSFNAS